MVIMKYVYGPTYNAYNERKIFRNDKSFFYASIMALIDEYCFV